MEKTFESEATRIHDGFEKAKTIIALELTVRYNPAHRIRTQICMTICNIIMRAIGSDFRINLTKHE